MINILVDTLGGDHSPDVNIQGAVMALKENLDIKIIFLGDEAVISEKLSQLNCPMERVEIVHAPDEISCNDKPTDAIRHKTQSSLYKAFEMMRGNDELNALVSNGSTGAIIAGSVLRLGRIHGIKRPAFCPVMPTMNQGMVAICDSGANVECDDYMLHQFAIMANLYLQKTYNIEKPRVALLNVGVEPEKGDTVRKNTYQLLAADKTLNFVGNMESRDAISGKYDLIVCDGFAGNVLCKAVEGSCLEMLKLLKATFTKNLKTKMGALFLKKDIMRLKDFMDYNNYGGGVLLGCAKTIIKGHGSCKAITIKHCIEQAYNIEKNHLRGLIDEAISHMPALA